MKKSIAILICFSLLVSCTIQKKTTNNSVNILSFELINYEYGKPLLKNDGDFSIRRSYQLKQNNKLYVIDRLAKGYEITEINIPESIINKIKKIKNLSIQRVKENLDKGMHFAGAYDYFKINNEEICVIHPLMSEELYSIKKDLFALELEKGKQKIVYIEPTEIKNFSIKIIPIHLKSNLPKIELPPPPAR